MHTTMQQLPNAGAILGPDDVHYETAVQHLRGRVPTAHGGDRAADVLAGLAGNYYDSVDTVYILDEHQRLQGLVRLRDLLRMDGLHRLGDVMTTNPARVLSTEDQEHIALVAIQAGISDVPVVDKEGRFLGVVPAQALIEILRREHVEDLHRLAGITASYNHVQGSLEAPTIRRLRARLPWLLVGLAGSLVATYVMACFEKTLATHLAVAFFVPAIVYLADAIGTQTEAIVVRFLSHQHAPLPRLLGGELAVGLLIGLSLAVLTFPAVVWGFADVRLGIAVSVSIVAAGGCAAFVGLLFPWVLSRLNMDPALGSGPLATIVQDVLSLLIYLATALAIMGPGGGR